MGIRGLHPSPSYPDADWLQLCGNVGSDESDHFAIGIQSTCQIEETGELFLFAIDLDRFYGNNFGKLVVSICRTA